ncbi:CU044_2847 family protein [Streptomyces sp. NPDC059491]|uniref:CU044_2847 family protein n=1 Tax=unclassified Streptomyces TaxID=2593676 RepID=UPI0036797092
MPEELARFALGDGDAAVYVAFEDESPQIVRARSRQRVPEDGAVSVAAGRFEEGLDQIRQMAGRTLDRLVAMPAPPSTVELEFGVKFNVETGVVVARTGVEGHIKVKVVWERGDGRRPPEEAEEAPSGGGGGAVERSGAEERTDAAAADASRAADQADAPGGEDGEG